MKEVKEMFRNRKVRICTGPDGWEKTGRQVVGYQWQKEDRPCGRTQAAQDKWSSQNSCDDDNTAEG